MPETRDWALIRRFTAPHANYPRLISQVKREPELLHALLAAVSSDAARVKFGAAKALRNLSGRAPDLIYPHFDFFASFLRNENSILRWNAILILGNLAAVDGERRVDRIIDDYLSAISGPHLIDAGNTIRGAAAMGVAKPYLADKIASHILEVERATYATPECRTGHRPRYRIPRSPLPDHRRQARCSMLCLPADGQHQDRDAEESGEIPQ